MENEPLRRPAALIDLDLGVIQITPEIAKTGNVRQIKIRPNLLAWLRPYPITTYPLILPCMDPRLTEVRAKFDLGPDVLRHTFISMHVSRFKSIGETALQAGNSESIICRHYLNMVGQKDAERFWSIFPQMPIRT